MKKLPILIAILVQIQLSSGQAYRPFLQDSAHWIMTTHYCECDISNPQPTDCWVQTTYSYKLGGTDTLNGIAYRQLIQSILRIVNPTPTTSIYCGFSSFTPCEVVALLREDTLARKVYVASGWCSQDSLLYDFSMQVGDSMKFNAACPVSGTPDSFYVVDSINYMPYLYGYPPVKTWYLHDIDSTYANLKLYESVGTSIGFWGYQLNFDEGQLENSLVEYCIGSDSACGFSCLNPLLGVTNLPPQDISIAVYPNPAKDILTVDMINLPPDGNLKFVITNILGQDLSTQTIINTKTEIDVSAFQPGIYVWHLLSDGNIVRSGKVVHD